MNVTLEEKVKGLEEQNRALLNRLMVLEDIEAIKKLQRSYGYYIEHWMSKEIADLFADGPDTVLFHVGMGKILGKEKVRQFFERNGAQSLNPEFLHQTMQLSPIIDVDPDGKTAKGRWYGLLASAIPHGKGVKEAAGGVVYENEYIKEDRKWKIKVLRIYMIYAYNPTAGIVEAERIKAADKSVVDQALDLFDIPDDTDSWYPSGYIVPFHFKHPITGKETSDKARNASLVLKHRKIAPI